MGTRLGVMGGTFDPIHYGHLVTAEEALVQFGLDAVLFVPTGRPWMKEHEVVSPAEDRYLMTVIATASNPLFRVSRMEVDRDGPTYTVDTLRGLKEIYGSDVDLFFVTGADAILEILQWKEPRGAVRARALHRRDAPGLRHGGVRGRRRQPSHPEITVMNIPALAISSTDIRRRVAAGLPIRYLVPEGVKSYMEKAGLYR